MLQYNLKMLIRSLIYVQTLASILTKCYWKWVPTYICLLLISKFKSTFSEKLPTPTFNCYHVQTRLKKSFRDLSSAFCAHQENHLVVESMTLHISSSSFMVMFFSNQITLQYASLLSCLSSTTIRTTCQQSSKHLR